MTDYVTNEWADKVAEKVFVDGAARDQMIPVKEGQSRFAGHRTADTQKYRTLRYDAFAFLMAAEDLGILKTETRT